MPGACVSESACMHVCVCVCVCVCVYVCVTASGLSISIKKEINWFRLLNNRSVYGL